MSGEIGFSQHLKGVWISHSIKVLGYEAPMTLINDTYVSAHIIQGWLDEGQTPERVLLNWNAGEGAKKCSRGVNKFNVKYDSCEYVNKGLITYNSIN